MTVSDAPIDVRVVTEADLPILRKRDVRTEDFVADARFKAMAAGEIYFIVAFIGENPAGTVVLDVTSDLAPEMRNMYVFKEARRRGVGHAMAEFVEGLAAGLGYEELLLGVDPENFEAIPLYLSMGFEPTGNHRQVVVEDEEGDEGSSTYHDAIYRKSLRFR